MIGDYVGRGQEGIHDPTISNVSKNLGVHLRNCVLIIISQAIRPICDTLCLILAVVTFYKGHRQTREMTEGKGNVLTAKKQRQTIFSIHLFN